jgi:DNA repair protein RadD
MPNRPYQTRMLQVVARMLAEGKSKLTIQMPTGSGKTRIATSLVSKIGNRRALYIVPSEEIFEQTSIKLDDLGISHTLLKAGAKPNLYETRILLAMSQTLARRKDTAIFNTWFPDVIFIDEIHKLLEQHKNIVKLWPRTPVVGLTATPVRLDGKSLANVTPFLVVGPTITDLQRDNFLVKSITYFGPSPNLKDIRITRGDYEASAVQRAYMKQGVLDVVPEHWKLRAKGRRTILFAPGVESSKRLVQVYRDHGIRAEHVDGETPKKDRKKALEKLRNHQIDVLCNVGLFIEGLDIVEVDCITLCQPTKSVARYLQQVGRGLRPSPHTQKKNLVIIDHSDNTRYHGRVGAIRDWQRGGKPLDVELRICRFCGAYTPKDDLKCLHCQFEEEDKRISMTALAQRDKDLSKNTPLRVCPAWAGAVRRLWYTLERERMSNGYPLPNAELGIEGFVENRCRKKILKTKIHNGPLLNG